MSTAAKIAISMEPELLGRIDRTAKRRKLSRSAYVREAVEDALARERTAELAARIDAVFADEAVNQEQRTTSEALGQDFLRNGSEDAW